jgi:antitoxin component of MazEF toxin-antitoxin module
MKSKIRKIGNSQGLIIPAAFLKELGVSVDDEVNVIFDNVTNSIIITHKETASHNDHLEQVIRNAVDQYLKEKGY